MCRGKFEGYVGRVLVFCFYGACFGLGWEDVVFCFLDL